MTPFIAAVLVPVVTVIGAAEGESSVGLQRVLLARGTSPGSINISDDASAITKYAAELLARGVEKLSGTKPEVCVGSPTEAVIVLATVNSAPIALSQRERDSLTEEAYLTKVVRTGFGQQVLVLGGSDRGLLYGAARVADLGLRSDDGRPILEVDEEVHAPALPFRGNYTLACHGKTHLYTLDDWRHIVDTMASDSMNVIMFWLSGLFPSERYPSALVYPETKLSVEDVRALIRHAHDRGIRFLLGTGVFAWFGVDALAEKSPESQAVGSGGMCPSSPLARRLNMEYVLEMLDAFPEADGLFLEIRDEYGPCLCATCQKPLDEHGSKQYGQAELSFLRELAEETWRRNPEAILISAVGYGEESRGAHTGDELFFRGVQQMSDPRFFWLVVRNPWSFPGQGGKPKPIGELSRNCLQWCQYYRLSTGEIAEWVRRTRDAGCIGFCPALEPGFCSASWYSDEIPYPVDWIPYVITRFAYREYCWNPDMTEDEFRARLLRRFFADDAPPQLAEDLLLLFDIIRKESQNRLVAGYGKWPRGCAARLLVESEKALAKEEGSVPPWLVPRERLRELAGVIERRSGALEQIERRLDDATPGLSPRGRDTAVLVKQALADSRAELCLDSPTTERVRRALERAEQIADERRKNAAATASATSQWNDTTYGAFNVLDGGPLTSWLSKDRAPLPQAITVSFREPRTIDYVRLVQGAYHRAYNTRAYRVEYSRDGKEFLPLDEGEFENVPGMTQEKRFAPVEAQSVRVTITSVYPNVDYSSPSLAEIDVGLGSKSWVAPEAK